MLISICEVSNGDGTEYLDVLAFRTPKNTSELYPLIHNYFTNRASKMTNDEVVVTGCNFEAYEGEDTLVVTVVCNSTDAPFEDVYLLNIRDVELLGM